MSMKKADRTSQNSHNFATVLAAVHSDPAKNARLQQMRGILAGPINDDSVINFLRLYTGKRKELPTKREIREAQAALCKLKERVGFYPADDSERAIVLSMQANGCQLLASASLGGISAYPAVALQQLVNLNGLHPLVGETAIELARGIQYANEVKNGVVVYCSARTKEDSSEYEEAQELGGLLVKAGYRPVIGGGPGSMAAVARGARLAGGRPIGLRIELPHEEKASADIAPQDMLYFRHFHSRKVIFRLLAQSGCIIRRGGWGTDDEKGDLLALIQNKKMDPIPVVLVGQKFWRNYHEWNLTALEHGAISIEDLDLYTFAETNFDILHALNSHPVNRHVSSGRSGVHLQLQNVA